MRPATGEVEVHPPFNVRVPDAMRYPVTPDGRYFVVRGRLWRCSDPRLPRERREALVRELMDARRRVGAAGRAGDGEAERLARADVHAAKLALGERGPVWWDDGAGDWSRRMAAGSPYAEWWAERAIPPS